MRIGIIGGAGAMGRTYVLPIARLGHKVFVSDINKKALEEFYKGIRNVVICEDEVDLLRSADVVIYSVPIRDTPRVISNSVKSIRVGAMVGGFTSVKTGELEALLNAAPSETEILTYHPFHAPTNDLTGHTFVIIPVREGRDGSRRDKMEELATSLGLNVCYVSHQEHDKITSDTQALTHASYLGMGLTWALLNINPKTHPTYVNSIDTIKRIHTTRILGANPNVYAGIALYNPYVTAHVDEFVRSIDTYIEMEARGDVNGLIRMCEEARQFFGANEVKRGRSLFDEVTSPLFGKEVRDDTASCLSHTALAYTMKKLGIHPRANIPFQTPPYKSRMLLIYRILDGDIESYAKNATENKKTQIHDRYFAKAVRMYAQTIRTRNYDEFIQLFNQSARFFGQEALAEGKKLSDEWIRRLISLQR